MTCIKQHSDDEQGFVLVGMVLTMLMMAVMALAMNRSAGMQVKTASNRTRSIQIHFGEIAAVEDARWQLAQNSSWRTAAGGENYEYNGVTYNRKALDCTIAGYEDAVTVSVTAPDAADTMTVHLRWQLINRSIRSSLFYIADTYNHRIRMVDTQSGIITTIAGTGTPGYFGDGGPATSAQLNAPRFVVVDKYENLYIADDHNHCIRKIDNATGDISTVAGTGTAGYNGDNIEAVSAQLYYPNAVFVDGHNNIYIGDEQNHRIRKVNGSTGIITTVAGTGTAGYNGDDIAAVSAQLNLEYDVGLWADDDGNIFIADNGNHRIRKVDGTTGIITTVAGTSTAGYNGDNIAAVSAMLNRPNGIWVDYYNNVYIADEYNHRIRKVNGTTAVISTVAGSGVAGYNGDGISATAAKLNRPYFAWTDADGDIYIADRENHRIRKVDVGTGDIATVAGTGVLGYSGDDGPAVSAQIQGPRNVFGRVYLKDTNPQYGWDLVCELQ